MWLINLAISLFGIIKTKALECVSVINQKCMPRPKILDVNEGIGEALFYPYKVLVNKCSGSCNTLDNPMSKICVPKIIKNVNIQVYNFLMSMYYGMKVVNVYVNYVHQYAIINKFGMMILVDVIVMKILQV